MVKLSVNLTLAMCYLLRGNVRCVMLVCILLAERMAFHQLFSLPDKTH